MTSSSAALHLLMPLLTSTATAPGGDVLELPSAPARGFAEDFGADGGVRPVFQPIVDLYGDTVVGYEALTRGPAGSAYAAALVARRLPSEHAVPVYECALTQDRDLALACARSLLSRLPPVDRVP